MITAVKAWFTSTWHSTESLSSIAYRAQGLAAVLGFVTAVLGVLALVTSWRKDALERADSLRQTKELAAATENARSATETARNASDVSIAASARIAEADARSAAATQAAQVAKLEQERIRQDNLHLSLRFEEERKARLLIEQRLAPRTVPGEFDSELATAVNPFRGQKVIFTVLIGDPETDVFARRLEQSFKDAGLQVEYYATQMFGSTPVGISFVVGEARHTLAGSVASVLTNFGLAAKPVPGEKARDPTRFEIVVGPKRR